MVIKKIIAEANISKPFFPSCFPWFQGLHLELQHILSRYYMWYVVVWIWNAPTGAHGEGLVDR